MVPKVEEELKSRLKYLLSLQVVLMLIMLKEQHLCYSKHDRPFPGFPISADGAKRDGRRRDGRRRVAVDDSKSQGPAKVTSRGSWHCKRRK